ncbi:hypothetical protein [Vibrio cholerae]|uniref:hypothetical protein n=1 Tax=Vibrio cholerae TaxID=666 RepID=UPI0030809050|nr:hypothetical protein [Vibrio cholerae]
MILHLSKTPLVGAPGKISKFSREVMGIDSIHFCETDYPGDLKGIFLVESICIGNDSEITYALIKRIKKASIIHVHNEISPQLTLLIKKHANKNVNYIYHVHSPVKEGPNFIEKITGIGIDFVKKLCVAQYHPRLYADYIPVPNIIDFQPSVNLLGNDEIPRVIFSPAHKRTGGRWNDKVSPKLTKVLHFLNEMKHIDLVIPGKVTPSTLYEIRKSCHITVDEIVTGGFHQLSLEGLAAGNVVINNSDFISNFYLEALSKGNQKSPFYTMNEENCYEKLITLLENKDMIREYQQKSYNFFTENLNKSRMLEIYRGVYDIN